MTVMIKKQAAGSGLMQTVEEISGVDLSACYQCKKCTSGCPVAKPGSGTPSEIIRRLYLGAGNEILETEIVWTCLSCGTCYARCPMGINTSAVMDALRTLALQHRTPMPKGNIPLFNRMFLTMVKTFGRTYDLPAIAFYRLGTHNIKEDMDKLPTMLKKGKMAVLPPSGVDRRVVKRIFARALQNKGGEK